MKPFLRHHRTSRKELDALICAARLRKSETLDNLSHCLVQAAIHCQRAFGFLRVFFYALREFLKIEATIATARGRLGLEWLSRRGNNVSCPKSDDKIQGLSNDKKIGRCPNLKLGFQFFVLTSATIATLTAVSGDTTGGISSTATNRSSESSLPSLCDHAKQRLAFG